MMNERSFSDRLKAFRKAKGLTQQQLADLLNVSNKSVSRWESDGGYPDVELLCPLARALGVMVDELLDEEPVQRLSTFDWQNMLSFGFAVGGGVLFYLLKLFTPSLLSYAIYLGALGYGVYLQSRYTYRSDWFYRFHLLTNFSVNLTMLSALPWISSVLTNLLSASFSQMFQYMTLTDSEETSAVIRSTLLSWGGWLLLWIVLALALTALTLHILRKKLDGGAPKNLWRCLFPEKKTAAPAADAEKVEETKTED